MSERSDRTHPRATGHRDGRRIGAVVAALTAVNLGVLALGFVAALVFDPAWFKVAWLWLTEFSPPSRFVWWMLALPITVILWGWRSPATLVRLLVLAGIALGAVAAATGLARLARLLRGGVKRDRPEGEREGRPSRTAAPLHQVRTASETQPR